MSSGFSNCPLFRRHALDAAMERIAAVMLRYRLWSPVARRIGIAIDDSGDSRLTGSTVAGVVRAYDLHEDGSLKRLLVELDEPIDYRGHHERERIRWVVAEPCLRWRRTSRLLWSWSVARIVDAPSFVDSTHARTIGIACLCLCVPRWALCTDVSRHCRV